MKETKYLSCLLVTMIMIGCVFAFAPQAVAAVQFTDLDKHWAAGQIKSMVDQGIIAGYPDKTFKPDAQVSRAEFVTMVNKAFQFTASTEITYPDVKADDWFALEISKAQAAGYLGGYADGSIKPWNSISRQEAAVIIAKAAGLGSGNEQELLKFRDAAGIPAWSKGALSVLVSKSYLGGYPDGTLKATNSVSRAEAVVMLAKAIGLAAVSPSQPAASTDLSRLEQAGTYGPTDDRQTVNGNVSISTSGVTLQNLSISGDLLIAEAVGNGDVTLKNLIVKGSTSIKGGGINTIKIDNCVLGKTVVNKSDDNIRLLLSGTTSISKLVADSAVKIEGQAVISRAIINKANVVIEAKPANTTIAPGISAVIAGKTKIGTSSDDDADSVPIQLTISASPTGGAVTAGTQVRLIPSVSGAAIYYTTDGTTEPSSSSPQYTGPITVNTAMTIKAIAVCRGYASSEVSTFRYTISPISGDLPAEVASFTANELAGQTYVTVMLKADSASTVDKVFVNGLEAVAQKDGLTFKKVLKGSVAYSAITITVEKKLIVKAGCSLTYVEIFGQSRARIETTDAASRVTANGNNMLRVDGKWQFDFDGDLSSVTIVATDGAKNETYILTK